MSTITSTFTLDNLKELNAAMADGAPIRVKYQDREVWYRTLNEMLRLRKIMRRELGLGDGSKTLFAEFNKGL